MSEKHNLWIAVILQSLKIHLSPYLLAAENCNLTGEDLIQITTKLKVAAKNINVQTSDKERDSEGEKK